MSHQLPNEIPSINPQLLQSVAGGDKEAFRQLFDRWWETVYSAALRLTKSPEMAEDLSQEVFIRVWDYRTKLPEVNNIGGFLYTITRNLTQNVLRKKILHGNNLPFLAAYFDAAGATPSQLLEQKELAQKIGMAVEKLPDHLRKVFRMSYLDGFSHREISEELQITPVSSRVFLTRALRQLREELSADAPGTDLTPLLLILIIFLHFFSERG